MVDYIFGNYLVGCGRLTKEQLHVLLQKQDTVRAKLGFLAVVEKMMTQEQADEVNYLQTVQDKKFGDIAVEKGYLTKEQLADLLEKQGATWRKFMQILVEEQVIPVEEFEWIAVDFKNEFGYTDAEMDDLKSDEVEKIIPLMLPREARKYQEIVCTMVRLIVRFVDRHAYIRPAAMVESLPQEDMVSQELVGENGFIDCLAERDGALLDACTIFGQEEYARLNMDALDAAGELLNCANGLFAAARSREGQPLELMLPDYCMNVGQSMNARQNLKDICRVPIFIGNRGLYFVVGEKYQ